MQQLRLDEFALLNRLWFFWSHAYQDPPEGDWALWVLMGGRGAGKTKAGAEWVNGEVWAGRAKRIGVIGETMHDARSVMVEGGSGLLHPMDPAMRPTFDPSLRRLRWPNGAVGHLFSADDPEQLRGPEFDLVWGDEFTKWRKGQAAFDMAQMCLRQGVRPRMLVTTTPTGGKALKVLRSDPAAVETRAATEANRAHLSPRFLSEVALRYGGVRFGRQELMGDVLVDVEDALWQRKWIDVARVGSAPPLLRIVVAVDPAVTSGPRADACGIVVVGRAAAGDAYVLADRTVKGASPDGWARAVHAAVEAYEADGIVVETNQGGELVRDLLKRTGGIGVPITGVSARLAKAARAAPIAVLYERGLVHHVGSLPELEDEMCVFGSALAGTASPDRVDALVWAIAHLMPTDGVAPRIRSV